MSTTIKHKLKIVMKPFAKTLHDRNHRYSAPEHTHVPKSSNDRNGTRSAKRQQVNKICVSDLAEEQKEENIKILDVFHQEANDGIPSHWCVQYAKHDGGFIEYQYFSTWTEANEYAMKYGYND